VGPEAEVYKRSCGAKMYLTMSMLGTDFLGSSWLAILSLTVGVQLVSALALTPLSQIS